MPSEFNVERTEFDLDTFQQIHEAMDGYHILPWLKKSGDDDGTTVDVEPWELPGMPSVSVDAWRYHVGLRSTAVSSSAGPPMPQTRFGSALSARLHATKWRGYRISEETAITWTGPECFFRAPTREANPMPVRSLSITSITLRQGEGRESCQTMGTAGDDASGAGSGQAINPDGTNRRQTSVAAGAADLQPALRMGTLR